MNVDLKFLLKQYLGVVPLKAFQWSHDTAKQVSFTPCEQRLIVDKVLRNSISQSYPPSATYRLAFLKHVIAQAEDGGNEVEEDLYLELTRLLAAPREPHSEFSYKSHNIRDDEYISLKESGSFVSHGTTGLTVWQASYYFMEWVLSSGKLKDFHEKSILELGCGLGFVGVATCRLCEVKEYIFTDCHENVLETLRDNVSNNLKEVACGKRVLCLDWEQEEQARKLAESLSNKLDYIIAAGSTVQYSIDRKHVFLSMSTVMVIIHICAIMSVHFLVCRHTYIHSWDDVFLRTIFTT